MSPSIEDEHSQASSDVIFDSPNETQLLDSLSSITLLSSNRSSRFLTLTTLPYEILEAILLDLSPKYLLLSQRVCRTFREIVSSSKRIRRALFLEPAHYSGYLETWTLLKWNPFLVEKLSDLFDIRVIGVHRSPEGPVKMVAHARYRKEVLTNADQVDVFLADGASWKEMLVTQPPATLLMHPSASLFWKSSMEDQAQFFHDPAGFTIMDMIACVDW